MTYNLTKSQQGLLSWVVEEVRAGNLNEEDIWFSWTKDGMSLMGYKGTPPQVHRNTVKALVQSGLLTGTPKKNGYRAALTAEAHRAVESDFEEPEAPAISEVIPLAEATHLDEELWERCRYSISADSTDPKAWDKAVRTATIVLEDRLREFGRTDDVDPSATGDRIVNLIFGSSGTWDEKMGDSQREAYRDLYAGAMGVFRNRYGHRLVDPSPKEGGAIISFVDLLLKMLDDLPDDEKPSDSW